MKTGRRGFFRMVAAAIAGAGATAAADSPLRGLAGVPSHPNCGYSWVPVGEGYPSGAKNYISGDPIARFSIDAAAVNRALLRGSASGLAETLRKL